MAPRKQTPKADDKALANWDEEMAKQAEIAAGMEESSASGQFFSIKSGILSWNDAAMPNNEMAVVIVDHVLENVFYDGDYDPDVPQSPTCFAFGRDEKTMKPHSLCFEAKTNQNAVCGLADKEGCCPMNEWASADKGKGKACRNVRRLAMLPAGTFDKDGKLQLIEDPDHYAAAAVGYMKLPVTSVKGYAAFVKQVAGALKRPPYGIITKVKVVPDPKSQFKVTFEPLVVVPNNIIPAIIKRNEEVRSLIEFPYQPNEEQAPSPKSKRKTTRRKY